VPHPFRSSSPALRAVAFRPANVRRPLAWRLAGDEPDLIQGEQARDRPLALVEAALILADEPLSARRLAALAGLADAAEAKRLVLRLSELYAADASAFQVSELAGGYQLLTRAEFHPWLTRLRLAATETHLTAAARETLAIVAYRQPVTRADVEAIRGVGSNDVLERFAREGADPPCRARRLPRPADAVRTTTKKFLQTFGLRSLRDLPPAEGLAVEREKEKRGEGRSEAAVRPAMNGRVTPLKKQAGERRAARHFSPVHLSVFFTRFSVNRCCFSPAANAVGVLPPGSEYASRIVSPCTSMTPSASAPSSATRWSSRSSTACLPCRSCTSPRRTPSCPCRDRRPWCPRTPRPTSRNGSSESPCRRVGR